MTPSPLAIIHIEANKSPINYSRRMYAIIRRYTPDVVEGGVNECFADLTGLRTFYKMSYRQLARQILADMKRELGLSFSIRISTQKAFEDAKQFFRKPRKAKKESIKTYTEMTGLSLLQKFVVSKRRKVLNIRYLGKVV